jgi:hypothetical protein
MILSWLYNPANYYKRLTYLGLNLKPSYKHKPDINKMLKTLRAFVKVCRRVGFNKSTGALFWQLFFRILFNNPKAIEAVVSFAAMYIHLAKHAQFIIQLTQEKMKKVTQNNIKVPAGDF